jgi:hypothetical protein
MSTETPTANIQHTPRYYTEWVSHWERYDLEALRRVIEDEDWSLQAHGARARAAVVVYVKKSQEHLRVYRLLRGILWTEFQREQIEEGKT